MPFPSLHIVGSLPSKVPSINRFLAHSIALACQGPFLCLKACAKQASASFRAMNEWLITAQRPGRYWLSLLRKCSLSVLGGSKYNLFSFIQAVTCCATDRRVAYNVTSFVNCQTVRRKFDVPAFVAQGLSTLAKALAAICSESFCG